MDYCLYYECFELPHLQKRWILFYMAKVYQRYGKSPNVTLIPKREENLRNYTPVPLAKNNYKLFAMILDERLIILQEFIHADQYVFFFP